MSNCIDGTLEDIKHNETYCRQHMDDENENTGSEDEENNFYSLGGENHHDLDEDKG